MTTPVNKPPVKVISQVDVIKKLMCASEKEIVTFNFASVLCQPDKNNGQLYPEMRPKTIRALKSLLAGSSPVFATMFSAKWDTNVIKMEDDVKFDQYKMFLLFLEVFLHLSPLSRYECYCCAIL